MAEEVSKISIRIRVQDKCLLCGTEGVLLYSELKDRLFSVPGQWSFYKCSNHHCGFIWLNPLPVREDLPKLYVDYFTHQHPVGPAVQPKSIFNNIFQVFQGFFRWPERTRRYNVMFLLDSKPGRVLDLGCGNGYRLGLLKALGWDVVGVEIDPVSRAIAQKSGYTVYGEELSKVAFPDNSFDAVIMCHVIEHLDDPFEVVKECLRVLKPGGRFVATTPNALSLGHRYFNSNWYALDPPRHLHLFSTRSIKLFVQSLGVDASVETEVLNAPDYIAKSLTFSRKLSVEVGIRSLPVMAIFLLECFLGIFNSSWAEELVLVVKKEDYAG